MNHITCRGAALLLLGTCASLSLSACKTGDALAEDLKSMFASAKSAVAPPCHECGVVSAIEPLKRKGDASGAGAMIGAVAGAVIGHQFGGGRGNDAATATGAIAGGVTGHQVERRMNSVVSYRVTVDMKEGGTRVIEVPDLAGLEVGSEVRVVGQTIQLASR